MFQGATPISRSLIEAICRRGRPYLLRFPLVHLKDMADDGTITDVGKGIVDFKSILGHSALAGMAYCFVEHDNPGNPMLSIETSLRFVRQLDI